jgi:hypothetical protein
LDERCAARPTCNPAVIVVIVSLVVRTVMPWWRKICDPQVVEFINEKWIALWAAFGPLVAYCKMEFRSEVTDEEALPKRPRKAYREMCGKWCGSPVRVEPRSAAE